MKFIIFDPDRKLLKKKLNMPFLGRVEYVTVKPYKINESNTFYSISIKEHYYLDRFIDSYLESYNVSEDFFSLILESITDVESLDCLLRRYMEKYSDRDLLTLSFFLTAFGYPVVAGRIFKYLLGNSEVTKIGVAKIARKFMYDFSDNNELLSEYYIENKVYLIKQGNKFYDQLEFSQSSIYFEKIVKYHNDKSFINKLALSLAKESQFERAEIVFENLDIHKADISRLSINGYISLLQMKYQDALKFYTLAIDNHPVNKIKKRALIMEIIRDFILRSYKRKRGDKKITDVFKAQGLTISSLKEFVNLIIIRSEVYNSIGDTKNSLKDALKISRWLRPDFYRAYETIYLIDKNAYKKSKKRLERYINWSKKILSMLQKKNSTESIYFIGQYLTSLKIAQGRLYLLEVDISAARDIFFKAYNLNYEVRALEWLAYSYFCLTDYSLSLSLYKVVLQKKPNRVPVILQIIRLYTELGELEKAYKWLVHYEDLLNSSKHKDASHLIRRNLYYLLSDFKKAWFVFRDRNICKQLSFDKKINYYPNVISLDKEIKDKSSVFILAEWGPGDELRWASIYGELENDFRELSIGCDPRLETLFKRSFPSINFVPINKKIRGKITPDNYNLLNQVSHSILTQVFDNKSYKYAKEQDFVTLISDVLGECRYAKDNFRVHKGVLVLDSEISQRMCDWIDSLPKKKLNIGICWKSGLIDSARSIHYAEIDLWEDILSMKNVNFINLQYANYEEDIKRIKNNMGIEIYNPDIDLRDDFESTAALIKSLDLVISPATAVAELSGMVGTDTILFTNSIEVDWRVLADNSDLWHSSVKHVRANRNTTHMKAQESIVSKIVMNIKRLL